MGRNVDDHHHSGRVACQCNQQENTLNEHIFIRRMSTIFVGGVRPVVVIR